MVLVVLQVIVSNQLAMLNVQMGSLDDAVYTARDTHTVLETAVASASSLMALQVRAEELGFHEPGTSQVLTLTPHIPVAFSNVSH